MSRNIAYTFIVVPDEGSYWIAFPDCDGCMTQAETLDEIVPMAEDALTLWLETRADLDLPLPDHRYDGETVVNEQWWQELSR